jgi:hypothetical protein
MYGVNVKDVGARNKSRRMPSKSQQNRADIIDLLTMYPDARRRVVRLLGEIGAR